MTHIIRNNLYIVIIISDDHSTDVVGCYGNSINPTGIIPDNIHLEKVRYEIKVLINFQK